MKELAPYISALVFILGLIVSFCVWVVNELRKKDEKISELNLKIVSMEAAVTTLKDQDAERKKDLEWIYDKLQAVSTALEVAKNNLEHIVLKRMNKNFKSQDGH